MVISSGAELLVLADDKSCEDESELTDEALCGGAVIDEELPEVMRLDAALLEGILLDDISAAALLDELIAVRLEEEPPLPLLSPPQATNPNRLMLSRLSLSGC